MNKHQLGDEVGFVQWGDEEEFEFSSVTFETPRPTAWMDFPTNAQPENKYKFGSLWINLSPDLQVVQRQTYSLLEWLGDIGGLLEALKYLGIVVLLPLRSFMLKNELISTIFHYVESLAMKETREGKASPQQQSN